MRELRILFTGVGRRVELIQSFREAARIVGINLKIYGADMLDTAPALAYCDHFRQVCSMKENQYIPELIRICRDDNIDLLIPTIDTDLLALSQNARFFGKTKVLVSSQEMVELCRDKRLTASFFEKCGCKSPYTVDDLRIYQGTFPCFIKPKDGSSSIDAFKVNSPNELKLYAQKIGDYVIQSYIAGTEYTVDVFCDFQGEPVYIVPRIRLQVRAGEVLKTRISLDPKIIDECKRIIKEFKPVGPITIQLIRENQTCEDYFIEINARFGGGAPLSMKAGAGSAEAILRLLLGEKVQQNVPISDGAEFSRFDQSVRVHSGGSVQPVRGVIFDLDDTLYCEKDYVYSGFKAISQFLGDPSAFEKLSHWFNTGKPAIDAFVKEIGCLEMKDTLLNIYREHLPSINLVDGAHELISELKNNGLMIGIITDGRPNGQWNKIHSLGLENLVDDIIVTDELGGESFRKPCDIAFRILQRKWNIPFSQLMYVGDNAAKDFQAPKQLGMQWVQVMNSKGLYHAYETTYPVVDDICAIKQYIK